MLDKIKNSSLKIYIALFYRNDTKLLTMPGKKDRDWFIIQALVGTVFALFTGATYLTGLFNKVHAPEILIAYLPIVGSIAGVITIFAGYAMQHIKSRKKIHTNNKYDIEDFNCLNSLGTSHISQSERIIHNDSNGFSCICSE